MCASTCAVWKQMPARPAAARQSDAMGASCASADSSLPSASSAFLLLATTDSRDDERLRVGCGVLTAAVVACAAAAVSESASAGAVLADRSSNVSEHDSVHCRADGLVRGSRRPMAEQDGSCTVRKDR